MTAFGSSHEPVAVRTARTWPAPVTDITGTGNPGHRPRPVPRRKISPTTAQCGGRRRSNRFSLSGLTGERKFAVRRLGSQVSACECALAVVKNFDHSPLPQIASRRGLLAGSDPAQIRQQWLAAQVCQEVELVMANEPQRQPAHTSPQFRPRSFDGAILLLT